MKVLILSQKFPTYHPRSGAPTQFKDRFLNGEKIHTLRKNEKGYFKDGDVVSVREWNGRPYASKQRVIKDGVRIGVEEVLLDPLHGLARFVAGPVHFLSIGLRDGLGIGDFYFWFFKTGDERPLRLNVIHFTDFRYEDSLS